MNYDLKEICKDIRCDIMTCIGHLGVGHIGGCLSVVELLAVLYFKEMNITEQGENTFREIETSICKDLSAKTGVVISTGGGVILRNENVFYLKNNGIMFFIDRNLEKIKATEDRPLSNSLDKLKQIYEVRYPIYKNNSDFQIISDENLYNTINKLKINFNED